ncbi:MAG: response regulator transcription factor [Myxococcota bacterium]
MEEAILIADGDAPAAARLASALLEAGYRVDVAGDGERVLSDVQSAPPSLLMLGMELPRIRGPEVLRRIRRDDATRALPVIAFSRDGDEIDRVLAFELGADDFVAKPFSERELVLRIRAVLRRASHRASGRRPARLQHGPIDIDTEARGVTVFGSPVALTAIELRLLVDLAERAGQVQRRRQLLERVWPDTHLGVRTVDTHIRRLREKLREASDWIETVRGVGYRMRAGGEFEPRTRPVSER